MYFPELIKNNDCTVNATELCDMHLMYFSTSMIAVTAAEQDDLKHLFMTQSKNALEKLITDNIKYRCFDEKITKSLDMMNTLLSSSDNIDKKTAEALTHIQIDLAEYIGNTMLNN